MELYIPTFLFDGSGAPAATDWGVVVEHERIAAVGPVSEIKVASARPISLEGTLLPGLIDCHVHVSLSGGVDPVEDLKTDSRARRIVRAIASLRAQRRAGVTAIRDLGGIDGLDLELARGIEEGWVEGPRMLAAGTAICMTGGHGCFFALECDGADAVRKGVRQQLRAGADVIKVVATGGVLTAGVTPGSAQMTRDELRAACEEAHKAGRRIAAHAQGADGICNAVYAGIDTIEHGFYLHAESIGMMVARGVPLVPTFAAAEGILAGEGKGVPAFMIDKIKRITEAHHNSFRAAMAAGVVVVCGTDAGTPLNPHGRIAHEIEALVRHGADRLTALYGATGAAADAIGRPDLGRLQRGRRADLLWVDGNPTTDLSALRRVRAVWMDGRQVEGAPVPDAD